VSASPKIATPPPVRTNLWERLADLPPAWRPHVESAIDRYGHGSCHALTLVAAKRLNLPLGALAIVKGDLTGTVIHSFGQVTPGKLTGEALCFDAYGINPLRDIQQRYDFIGANSARRATKEEIAGLYGLEQDEEQDARAALTLVLRAIGHLAGDTSS
jgi:hypothetical protein